MNKAVEIIKEISSDKREDPGSGDTESEETVALINTPMGYRLMKYYYNRGNVYSSVTVYHFSNESGDDLGIDENLTGYGSEKYIDMYLLIEEKTIDLSSGFCVALHVLSTNCGTDVEREIAHYITNGGDGTFVYSRECPNMDVPGETELFDSVEVKISFLEVCNIIETVSNFGFGTKEANVYCGKFFWNLYNKK
jgi:hypothetical protein